MKTNYFKVYINLAEGLQPVCKCDERGGGVEGDGGEGGGFLAAVERGLT